MISRRIFVMFAIVFTSMIISACDARLIGVTLNPVYYDYGSANKNIAQPQYFKLTNKTTMPAEIVSFTLTGDHTADFYIDYGVVTPFTLQPLETRTYTIIFNPQTGGKKYAELVIMTSLEQSRIVTAELRGECFSADIKPEKFDFGIIDIGDKTQNIFKFVNTTDRDINVTSIEVLENGAPAVNYRIVTGTPGLVVAKTGTLDIEIEFEPINFGTKKAQIVVKTDDISFQELFSQITGFGNLDLFEEFDDKSMCDTAITTAEWSTLTVGKLIPTGMTNFGTGVDGVYNPTSSTTLDADNSPYEFSEINIPSHVTVTVIGTKPLEILCQGNAIIEGKLVLDGEDGQDAGNGGAGGPGGYAGGNGGTVDTGDPGDGPGGGAAGVDLSGGGAGHTLMGQDGFSNGVVGATGGASYGNASISNLEGGSGGGGGSVDYYVYHANYTGGGPGGGGGGGGGAMLLTAAGEIEIKGTISANGGNGGGFAHPGGSTSMCFGGGGGSGGAIKIISAADIKFDGGVISVLGGFGGDGMVYANNVRNRGGYGSSGMIRLEDFDGVIDGVGASIYPIPSFQYVSNKFGGGTGADGVFNPTSNINLNTDNGAFNYSSVIIPAGVTVTVTGSKPLEIYCTGNIEIGGTIDVSGEDALYQTAGIGKAGGASGGAGGNGKTNGQNGEGTGGGHYGSGGSDWGGASGGGFGTAGQKGSLGSMFPGGITYGTPSLSQLFGGSGGGGGGGDYSDSAYAGGGGGAGGGAVRVQAAGTVTLAGGGKIFANGGKGGYYGGQFGLPGAGGSGGGILIQGEKLVLLGEIYARGGPAGDVSNVIGGWVISGDEPPNFTGSWGGEGRIRLETRVGNLGAMLLMTKGKYSSPTSVLNPEFRGTCSIQQATLNAGLVGQSLWFDSTTDDPVWQDAVLTGTYTDQIKVYYEGAEDDGFGMPDLNTLTGWKSTAAEVGNTKYLRFRIQFTTSSNTPELDRIDLPFTE